MAYFHSSSFSTHENECGSCARMEVNKNSFRWYCSKYRRSYPIDSKKCSDHEKDRSRDYDFWRDIYTYHISTAVCQILDFDINSSLFQGIKKLRDEMEKDSKYQSLLTLYDTFGPYIATKLHQDQNNYDICTYLVTNCFPKVVLLVNEGNLVEAIKEYSELVKKLYQYYQAKDRGEMIINAANCLDATSKVLSYKLINN